MLLPRLYGCKIRCLRHGGSKKKKKVFLNRSSLAGGEPQPAAANLERVDEDVDGRVGGDKDVAQVGQDLDLGGPGHLLGEPQDQLAKGRRVSTIVDTSRLAYTRMRKCAKLIICVNMNAPHAYRRPFVLNSCRVNTCNKECRRKRTGLSITMNPCIAVSWLRLYVNNSDIPSIFKADRKFSQILHFLICANELNTWFLFIKIPSSMKPQVPCSDHAASFSQFLVLVLIFNLLVKNTAGLDTSLDAVMKKM